MNAHLKPDHLASANPGFHPDEWAARLQLAACYRVFALLGWVEMIYNHITVRLPDSVAGATAGASAATAEVSKGPLFLINPFGLHYSEVTASNLLKIDLAGNKIATPGQPESPWPVNPAGFTVHAAIHAGLPDAHCVMHTHTTSGMAVACLEGGLQQTNFYTAQLHNMVAYHDFEGITIHADEGPRLLASMGRKPAVILRNHGLLAWGKTLPQAFAVLWTLQRACDIQLATFSMGAMGGKAIPVSAEVAAKCTRDALQYPDKGGGEDVFNAMVRQVDRIDKSYRE
jgi:ribulose-5-phosphate 4-epimerase/fuculose-1-phosphate aldolase